MRPKFHVGEEVVTSNTLYPESNGEYVITGILDKESACIRALGSLEHVHLFKSKLYYSLSGLQIKDKYSPEVKYDFLPEESLRKKHKPSEMSFNELMHNIGAPSHV